LLARLGGLRGLEGRLELLQPVVEVHLAAGQLAEPVHYLPRLALLLLALRELLLLGTGRALLLVAVLLVRQLELLELPLRRPRRVPPAPTLPAVAADDVELAVAQLQERLVGRLLGGQGRGERRDRRAADRLAQAGGRVLHEPGGLGE